jgi:hypothetical protein
MSLRASVLALLTAAATFAGTTAEAGGLAPNLNIPVMTGRPIIGYGPSFVPQPNYSGAVRDHCRTTRFDPNSPFGGCTDNMSAGNTTLKPPK